MLFEQDVRLLFQINRCMVNTILFQFDLMQFQKDLCMYKTAPILIYEYKCLLS